MHDYEFAVPPPVRDGRRVAGIHRPRTGVPPSHPDVPVALEEVALRAGVQRGIDAGRAEPTGPPPLRTRPRITRIHRPRARVPPSHPDIAITLKEVALRAGVQ